MEARVAAVEPLPLVPAMSTEGKLRCGLPSASQRTRMCARSNLREASEARGRGRTELRPQIGRKIMPLRLSHLVCFPTLAAKAAAKLGHPTGLGTQRARDTCASG